jgi:hypothetical protein
VIAELRALLQKHEGPRGPEVDRRMLCAAIGHQGFAGSVWIVSRDTFNAERLRKTFVEIAIENNFKGMIRGHRQVVIDQTSYHFITLGEDGTLTGQSPRYIDDETIAVAIRNLIRDHAESAW